MDVSVIIVNYNTADLLTASIDSVLAQEGVSFEIIVIDNASQDESHATMLAYGSRIKTLLNPRNVGFGSANNIAFQQSRGRYIYLLNPDAVLKQKNALQRVARFMDAHSEYGLAGTRLVKKATGETVLPRNSYPDEKHLTVSLGKLPGDIAWVLGASLMIRREVYETTKGFDESFFLYAEEADFCLRVRQHGYAIGYCDEVSAEHVGGGSERKRDIEVVQRRKQEGLHRFYIKHYSPTDVMRLLKRNKRRALARMFLLSVKGSVWGLSDRQQIRLSVYRAVFQASAEFIGKFNCRKSNLQ